MVGILYYLRILFGYISLTSELSVEKPEVTKGFLIKVNISQNTRSFFLKALIGQVILVKCEVIQAFNNN